MLLLVALILASSLAVAKGDDPWTSETKLSKILQGAYPEFKRADPAKYLPIARITQNGKDLCLATVADRDWIITAAHCVHKLKSNQSMSSLRVIVGDFKGGVMDKAEQNMTVKDIIIHENFKEKMKPFYDIALVQVSSAIMFNNFVVPVNIPAKFSLKKGTAYVTTWLPMSASENKGELVELSVDILKKAQCIKKLSNGIRHMGKARFCTSDSLGAASCFASQADPVFIEDNNGIIYQVGIVNHASECGSNIAVHTKLPNFNGWIQRKISSCKKPQTVSSEEWKK